MKRIVYGVILADVTLLSACKQPNSDAQQGIVTAGQDVVIKSVRLFSATENNPEAGQIYIVDFTFTNHLGIDFVPLFNHFILEDENKTRHSGMESGSAVLVGLSNSEAVLKEGDTREYTLGFRVPISTTGTLFYDPT